MGGQLRSPQLTLFEEGAADRLLCTVTVQQLALAGPVLAE